MKVAFFPGCMVDMFYPEVGMAAVSVLERLGCEVTFPDEVVCCGQPFTNSGYIEEVKPMMRTVIDAYMDFDTIVSLTGSCAWAIVGEYPKFLADDPEYLAKLEVLTPKIYEFTDFLVNKMGKTDLGAYLPGKATYHKSCHLTRLLGVKEPPITLLKNVEGLEYVEMKAADRCCGFGGTFSVKEPEISQQMVEEKVRLAVATGADYLVGADQACLMNIKGALDRMKDAGQISTNMQVMHIAQVLDSRKEA